MKPQAVIVLILILIALITFSAFQSSHIRQLEDRIENLASLQGYEWADSKDEKIPGHYFKPESQTWKFPVYYQPIHNVNFK